MVFFRCNKIYMVVQAENATVKNPKTKLSISTELLPQL